MIVTIHNVVLMAKLLRIVAEWVVKVLRKRAQGVAPVRGGLKNIEKKNPLTFLIN